MKQKLNLGFTDTHDHLAQFFYNLLSTRYDIQIDQSNPEFLIFGDANFGNNNRKFSKDKVVKIFYTGENQRPERYDCSYAISFDRKDEPWHYRLPLYVIYMWALEHIHKTGYTYDYIFNPTIKPKSDFCTFVVSNSNCKERNTFFELLNIYKKVDSGGRYQNNIQVNLDGEQAKIDFLSSRKFNIAFESYSHPGYVTEKILHAFYAGTIPIYWGDPTIAKDFNPDSFINVHDFKSFEHCIEFIKELDCDDDLYQTMLNAPKFKEVPSYINLNNFLDWFDSTVYKKVNKREDTVIYF
jgi:hypothetical protein